MAAGGRRKGGVRRGPESASLRRRHVKQAGVLGGPEWRERRMKERSFVDPCANYARFGGHFTQKIRLLVQILYTLRVRKIIE